jgi:hypothetical protein
MNRKACFPIDDVDPTDFFLIDMAISATASNIVHFFVLSSLQLL